MIIYCCECNSDVEARLTDGAECYSHRKDLFDLPFWKCDGCGNFVGCHHKTKNRTRPLGVIPTKEIKEARKHIHRILDPIYEQGLLSRKHLYARISDALGYQYHTAEIMDIQQARRVYAVVRTIRRSLT